MLPQNRVRDKMAVITGSGTTLGLELEIASGAPALFVEYKRLGTDCHNGEVFSPVRPVALVVPQSEGAALVARVRRWIGEISTNQSIIPAPLADLPLEVTSSVTVAPDGITYEAKIGDLSVEIDWDKAIDPQTGDSTVTIHAGAAFTISYEAFDYYVSTLEDLVKAIELEKLA